MQVDFFRHALKAEDASRIAEVLATPFLTSGAVGRDVEAQLCRFFGSRTALLVNSWTNGALATLLALGVGPGDEVIVPAMTFISTANVAEMVGAKPVFVDVDPETLLMQPSAVEAALSARTRAVIPVHLYGQMCDVAGIREVLGKRGGQVAIIEDAAHCFEGSRGGRVPGQDSDAAIFSFYATKNVTCAEGGAIITNDTELGERIRQTRLHGMSQGAVDRFRAGQYRHWDMERLGVKANLPDLLAALLAPQIETIRARLPVRQALSQRYRGALSAAGVRMPRLVPGTVSAEHIFPIWVPPPVRDHAISILNGHGISVTVNYRSVPTLTFYREKYGYTPRDFPVSQAWGDGTITLPFYPGLPPEQQDFVIQTVLREVLPLGA